MTEYTSANASEGYCWTISSAVAPASKGGDQGVERHPRATDADHAVGIGLNRNPLGRNVQFHWVSVGGLQGAVNFPSRAVHHPAIFRSVDAGDTFGFRNGRRLVTAEPLVVV
jgi:hypothetical protein